VLQPIFYDSESKIGGQFKNLVENQYWQEKMGKKEVGRPGDLSKNY